MRNAVVFLALSLVACTPRYHYECSEYGEIPEKRCVEESSTHVSTGVNCLADSIVSMSGSEYCHRCSRYETVMVPGCVKWDRIEVAQ
jgi:hypothetical protein